ncbi:SNF2 family N-terminal domain-containing protein [Crepidotus variabilis]|uniref:SNF2 family N-terminal domain-containing protein n=1 Tax=Crepidotus variabilis TaxID=179855 RepID=A0A9P6EEU4_9AGAR|nr:SNF2 family N-terminal domain-containing protein [Crepidotus variabilis]
MSLDDKHTIDLTLDEDDDRVDPNQHTDALRYSKRPQIEHAPQAPTPSPSTSQGSSTASGPSMSPFTRQAFSATPLASPSIFAPPIFPGAPNPFATYPPQPYMPAFAGPAGYRPPNQTQPAPSPPPFNNVYQQQFQRSQQTPPRTNGRQVIDLTSSPSPPPSNPPGVPFQPALPPELPPKTPVCIGQLTVTALILYPVPYTIPQGIPGEPEWVPVRLIYEHTPHKEVKENISIRTPSSRGLNGETLPGDTFAVVEKKAAASLGPMLGKGLIRLDCMIRKGPSNLPILPLQMLMYTPKGNIPVVSNYLRQCDLLLDHPSHPFNGQRIGNYLYYNPHEPPPEGHRRITVMPQTSRWQTTAARSVEIQRSQVDELFKSLKDDDDFPETEPCPEISTRLYPHQKKAVTFLLDREREHPASDVFSSLWQKRVNQVTGQTTWFHLVTQKEEFEAPKEAKGAILADDMGLGKTITCVSLMGATYNSSVQFAKSPIETVPRPPRETLDAAHFAGSVWGMPDISESSGKSKGKAKAAEKAHDRLEADYARKSRIKAKSRATLIICPLSTVSNWEDQFREHWKGEVAVVGGQGGTCTPAATPGSSQQITNSQSLMEVVKAEKDEKPIRLREGRSLRVYIYHGNARRPDPAFLADFDAVITTYATLASEFSKQNKSLMAEEDEDDGDSGGTDIDENGQGVMRPTKKAKTNGKKKKAISNGQANACEHPSALQSIHWFRVVLDEAHSIKETGTVASRACCDLMADRRLCLTGTPVQNKLDDVFALVKFLRLAPFDDKNVWTEYIGSPVKYGQALGVARLQTIMKCITLRRTKESKAPDGSRILDLPPRRDELRTLKFDPQEKEIYDRFFTESKQEFTDLSEKNEVMKNYVGILQKILRLRQICDHFELVEGKGPNISADDPGSYEDIVAAIANEGFTYPRAAAIFAILREAATTQCVECGGELCLSSELNADPNEAEQSAPCPSKRGRKGKVISSRAPTRASSPNTPRPVLTRCQHLFCIMCYRNSICPGWPTVSPETLRSCSACQTALSPSDAFEILCDTPSTECAKKKPQKREKRKKGQFLENFVASTKIKSLLLDLSQFSKINPYSANYDAELEMTNSDGGRIEPDVVKTVVFSQWTSMLDKVEDAFELANIKYERLDGTMRRDERVKAMEALKHDPSCEVLLVSLKAGGVGLNLTAASRCYLLDPYWNPAVENQAVDRIHRLGQTRPVTTIKFVIEGSIEERLLEVQKKKTELANMTLNNNITKSEILQRRMDELSALFGP